jgi:hypothetical protein
MTPAKRKQEETPPMSLEELARRMLAMRPKERSEMVKKKPKKRAKK